MKLISDFDGVLTELSHEALRVKEIFLREWEKHVKNSGLSAKELFQKTEDSVLAQAEKNGWEVNGRISAYADEDFFIYNNALAAWLDRQKNQTDVANHASVLMQNGHADFKALAQHAYMTMVGEVMNSSQSPIDPKTAAVTAKVIGDGHDIVVVSNSGTDRILDIFKKNDICATAHPESSPKTIRVRGNARKFELCSTQDAIKSFCIGPRTIEVSRPVYEQMIREERPDAVMGDVFSLDLATPAHLARTQPEFFPNGLKIILRKQNYTPKWVLDYFASNKEENLAFYVLERLEDLPQVLND